MIKRLIMILAVLFGLTLGGASMASAGEQHHGKTGHHKQDKQHGKDGKHKQHGNKGHHPKPPVTQCPSSCKPKPTPPPGGWPCMKDHSCKPHKPHCPPVKPPHHPKPPHHHKPPHVKPPVHHKPPVVKPPVHTVTHVQKPPVHIVTTASVVPALPRTGGFASQILMIAILLLVIGGSLVLIPRIVPAKK